MGTKKLIKNARKARNWTGYQTALLCKILADPMNYFLPTLESRALKKAWFSDFSLAIVNNFFCL